MTITTITIETVGYTSYASLLEADTLLNTDPVREVAWELLTDDEKGKKLVAATRRLDLLDWGGTKTGAADVQENAWPRTGLSYKDGTPVSTTEVPKEVENATIFLAGSIAIDASAADAGTSGSNIKSVKAGSADVKFFRGQDGVALQDETSYDLVACFLSFAQATDGAVGNLSTESDPRCSRFDDADRFTFTKPLA